MSGPAERNVLLTVEYDGTAYVGWQRQPSFQGVSVQQRLEEALSHILSHPVSVVGAGRTDAGVHALGQRCNFRCDKPLPLDRLPLILNHRLPPDIRVSRAEEVPAEFHARFCARGKHYRYLLERQAPPSAFGGRWSWQLEEEPDVGLMRQAAASLMGEHDFRHYTLAACETKTFTRTVTQLELTEPEEPVPPVAPLPALHRPIVLDIEGSGFLYKMVRLIAGRLVALGLGQLTPEEFAGFLDGSCQRNIPPAPAKGLTLMEVRY